MTHPKKRLAIVVSHPIQYYAPLYQRLALRNDLVIRVFFTWHGGEAPVQDRGFGTPVAWDIPLTEGYDFEVVPNLSRNPGTHHFLGLRNPSLVERILEWKPDAVHVTGWACLSHLQALWAFHKSQIPVLFRGDSHLLNVSLRGPYWWVKRAFLKRVYSWPAAFLVVGSANRAYYKTFGVGDERLHHCPHSIDVVRFAEPADRLERESAEWRRNLGIAEGTRVLLFAGKFERTKQPLMLMSAVRSLGTPGLMLVMVGGGALEAEVIALAAAEPCRFRILPFQNQSRMPLVYRLGNLFVLPSMGETWGLAVNEALACGRPVLVSDRVGCAADVVDATFGRVFPWNDSSAMMKAVEEITVDPSGVLRLGHAASIRAWAFDTSCAEAGLVESLEGVWSG